MMAITTKAHAEIVFIVFGFALSQITIFSPQSHKGRVL